jgi:hypothetical protein
MLSRKNLKNELHTAQDAAADFEVENTVLKEQLLERNTQIRDLCSASLLAMRDTLRELGIVERSIRVPKYFPRGEDEIFRVAEAKNNDLQIAHFVHVPGRLSDDHHLIEVADDGEMLYTYDRFNIDNQAFFAMRSQLTMHEHLPTNPQAINELQTCTTWLATRIHEERMLNSES